MKQPLQNLLNMEKLSELLKMLNAWMITQYCHSYPKREMLWLKYKLDNYTPAKRSYQELIRKLSEVLNVYVYRDVAGDNRGMIYILGRRKLAETFRNTLLACIIEIELGVKNEYDWQLVKNRRATHFEKNPRTVATAERCRLINIALQDLETILNLKREFYLDKYARIRKVRENEMADQTFFLEYIKENNLIHLKRFKYNV